MVLYREDYEKEYTIYLKGWKHTDATKEKDGVHGIGLKNVKRIVTSQEGLIDFFEENGNFCVHIFYS